MMQDQIGIPACFSISSGETLADDPSAVSRSGQSVFMSVYRTKLGDECGIIRVTWCKKSMLHGLSVSVEGQCSCKVELKPWYFWRKQGTKRFAVDGKAVDIFWDLRAAKFNGETEPCSEYYVAVVCDEQVVLLLGDMKKDAYRKTGCRPSLADPTLVSRKEHVFGRNKFSTRMKFHDKGRQHVISIECKNRMSSSVNNNGADPEMEMRIDGYLVIHVEHLQWKFRGYECVQLSKVRIQVYWDVHDWLFVPGLRHASFIFKPIILATTTSVSTSSSSSPLVSSLASSSQCGSISSSEADTLLEGVSEFSQFLYAWTME